MCIRDSINAEYGGTEFKMDLSQRATVAITTSYDERNPPASMLDGFDRSFWATGGMYPQEFVIQLESPSNIDAIRIVSSGIRNLSCEARDASQGNSDFVKVTQETLENAGNQQQSKDIQVCCWLSFRMLGVRCRVSGPLICGSSSNQGGVISVLSIVHRLLVDHKT
eukprot:TRINITY_DN2007_c0_g1_i10.p1 TRINITY_DN2007_c0_g1~~TRINITY_DN2007_c0_g1_i10.p1  ORF type:complete len:166 (+),score=20.73 TRINITY_DN2007_c0_g1_i10:119-616(+)